MAYARAWHLVNLRNAPPLGRIASRIAQVLMGKHKPIYDPAADCGDYVVCINAKHVNVSGKKREQKVYRKHSGWVGGLKEVPFQRMMERRPEEVSIL